MESKNIDNHIETYYERNNLNIPDAEKEVYLDKDNSVEFDPDKFSDENEAKKYKLFRGYLATQKIKEDEGDNQLPQANNAVCAIPISNNSNLPIWYNNFLNFLIISHFWINC